MPSPTEVLRHRLAADSAGLSNDELMLGSEVAIRAQAFDVAVNLMQLLVERVPPSGVLYHRLGICRMQAGQTSEALASFGQAVAWDPTRAETYQAMISLAVSEGDLVAALFHARAQARACGSSMALVMQIASILTRDGRVQDALKVVHGFNQQEEATSASLRFEAELAAGLGLMDQAIAAASRALTGHADNADMVVFLAQLYCNCQRYEEAITLLQPATHADAADPRLHRMLSASLACTGKIKPALAAAIGAVQRAPGISEYWLHAAMLAHTLGFGQQATELAAKATELDPGNARVWTAYARLLQARGGVEEAVLALDTAMSLSPDDTSIKDFQLDILARRGAAGTQPDETRPIRPLPRSRERREPARNRNATLRAAGVQLRVIAGLTARAINHRAIRSRFGFLSALFEPVVQVLAVGVALSMFNQSRPPLGQHFFFFYATGLLPLYLFIHVCNHTLEVFREQQTLLQIPIIKRLDLVISEALAELILCGATALVTFAGFELLGWAPYSDNQMQAVAAYLMVFALAFGFGLSGAVINNYVPGYAKVWGILQRFLYFTSGVIILAERMPTWIRSYEVWNPMLLLITWFRVGFFPQYEPPWLDKSYVVFMALGLIVLGLVLERASRRHMRLL